MGNSIKLTLTGIDQIDKVLKGLPDQLTEKVLVSAGRDALKPVTKSMKSNLASKTTSRTDNLNKSIGTRKLGRFGKGRAAVFAGPRVGRWKGYHAHLVEHGTQDHSTKKKKMLRFRNEQGELVFVRKVRGTRPRPFAKPAIRNNIDSVRNNYRISIGRVLIRYMKRTIKSTGGSFQ